MPPTILHGAHRVLGSFRQQLAFDVIAPPQFECFARAISAGAVGGGALLVPRRAYGVPKPQNQKALEDAPATAQRKSWNKKAKEKGMALKKLQNQTKQQRLEQQYRYIAKFVQPDEPGRERTVHSDEEMDRRALLAKSWARYVQRTGVLLKEDFLRRRAQEVAAMKHLRGISPALYEPAAVEQKEKFPIQLRIPVDTPPIPGYKPGCELHELPGQPQPGRADANETVAS